MRIPEERDARRSGCDGEAAFRMRSRALNPLPEQMGECGAAQRPAAERVVFLADEVADDRVLRFEGLHLANADIVNASVAVRPQQIVVRMGGYGLDG